MTCGFVQRMSFILLCCCWFACETVVVEDVVSSDDVAVAAGLLAAPLPKLSPSRLDNQEILCSAVSFTTSMRASLFASGLTVSMSSVVPFSLYSCYILL